MMELSRLALSLVQLWANRTLLTKVASHKEKNNDFTLHFSDRRCQDRTSISAVKQLKLI